MILVRAGVLLLLLVSAVAAEPLRVKLQTPGPVNRDGFKMGTSANPAGVQIGIHSRALTRQGQAWMPVMGEFHFSRCPQTEWRDELLRMKAGGIDIVASYVFWNHHEEVQGEWDWSGQRDLRTFVQLCEEVGMLAAIRVGPWCHGEVRNGGIPDWAVKQAGRLRSNDPKYLQHVRVVYQQIAQQLAGLLWKEGGPVVAIQLENEYGWRAEHLLTLKEIALECGLDVPLYTRTGWPRLATPMPFGEIAPLYGAYAEGFWDRKLRSMPGKYWAAFRFQQVRTDAAIATEQLGERAARDEADSQRYPYLTCELGGGMMSSYHRRILMLPEDIEAVAIAKVGSGGNLPGYYMYHGGVNPVGKRSTLMERQTTAITNYNDLPERNYDFQAPIGSYGQTRPHYHALRRMHLLFRDFGHRLAMMTPSYPEEMPGNHRDLSTLRWVVRSDGEAGFLFVNNHQRSAQMPEHPAVQFALESAQGTLTLPDKPITVLPGARFVWPVRMPVVGGRTLQYATAQPICQIATQAGVTYFFAQTPGVPATFRFADGAEHTLQPDDAPFAWNQEGQAGQIVLLSDAQSQTLWKGHLSGRDRVVLSPADVLFDRGKLRLRSEDPQKLTAKVYPPINNTPTDNLFETLTISKPASESSPEVLAAKITQLRNAGPALAITMGSKNVAQAPVRKDYDAAAAWQIDLPEGLDLHATDAVLTLAYQGDTVQVKIAGQVVMDDFYNGRTLEVGLHRYAEQLAESRRLTVEILPLPADAPIFLPGMPGEGYQPELISAEIVQRHHVGWE